MRWQPRLGLCVCLLSGLVGYSPLSLLLSPCQTAVSAAEPNARVNSNKLLDAQVSAVLRQEADGQAVDRRALGSRSQDNEFAAWQAGLVRNNDAWCPVETLDTTSLPANWKEYTSLRDSSPNDASGHRKLAIWCAKHKLDVQARAHWLAVIELDPNDVQARTQLGHSMIGGLWFSDEQCQHADATRKELLAGLSKWSSTCQKIATSLASPDLDTKKKAMQRLRAIHDPSAIPALEIACLQSDESLFEPWLESIAQFRSREACLAFIRIALSGPESARGVSAIKHIKTYTPEFYVPELLSLLSTPVETKIRYGVNEYGEMTLRRAMFRDTNNQKQVLEFERVIRTNDPTVNQIPITLVYARREKSFHIQISPIDVATAFAKQTNIDEVAAAADAMEGQKLLDSQLAEFNRINEKLSSDVYTTLEKTTGANPGHSADAWWQWWRDANYRTLSAKPITYKGYRYVDRPQANVPTYVIGRFVVLSCLVGGTQVQTRFGLRPIESLQVGDEVLSQDVETGELGLKPVIRTTLREPAAIIRIETASGDIRTTAGHRWWVPGQGWLMSKQLQPDMLLHNVTGTTKILKIEEEAQPLPTHNLVVDGYHTYFVGKERVLSFDNVEPEPTLRAVPGFGQVSAK